MNQINLKDHILARICSYCSFCRQALDIPFAGVRVQPGVVREYLEKNSEDITDISVLCGAGLPASLETWNLVEHPIISTDGKILGIFFAPNNAATSSTDALRPFVARVEELLRQLYLGAGTYTYGAQNTAAIPQLGLQIFDLSIEPFCIAGADGYFKRANASLLNTLGLSEEDLKRTPFLTLVHPSDRMASVEALGNLLDKGRGFN